MSVREEDREKTCPSRGLGIAAAAIGVGVGVGAALYYFFSKRPENPHNEGSTSDWSYERSDTFIPLMDESDGSFITTSENETTDTSINVSPYWTREFDRETHISDSEAHISDSDAQSDSDGQSDSESHPSDSETDSSDSNTQVSDSEISVLNSSNNTMEHANTSRIRESDLDSDWDVTTSSSGVPEVDMPSTFDSFINLFTPRRRTRTAEDEQVAAARRQAFRERTWTHEDCSICFEVMLRTQELMTLPCTHNFHTQCILPWLQEQQTCPNCRKLAE